MKRILSIFLRLTLILGFEDIPVEQAAADARARQAQAQATHA